MSEPWYKASFQADYLTVYKHRDAKGAAAEVAAMSDWLQLEHKASVLDLCCGSGRHSLILDKLGFRVTGVDLSETLLAEARASEPSGRIRWVHGDMRDVPIQEPFNAVFNLFTSFGYFEADAGNQQVLREISRLLRSGGRFVIDFLNPSFVSAHLVPYSERLEGPLRIEERRSIQDGYVHKIIRLYEPGAPGSEREYRERVKLYELPWFRTALREAGLRLDAVYGSYAGQNYEAPVSPRMIMIGTKEGGWHG